VVSYLQNRKRKELLDLEQRYGVTIALHPDHSLPRGEPKLEFIKQTQGS
jgi:hypothetical protein